MLTLGVSITEKEERGKVNMDKAIKEKWINTLKGVGNKYFDAAEYLSGEFGDHQIMLLEQYEEILSGVTYELHEENGGWASYVPKNLSAEKVPAVIGVYNNLTPVRDLERLGFASIAAKKGFIFIGIADGNNEEAVIDTIKLAGEIYPIDMTRIYITGHSFGGSSSSRHAIRNTKMFAGVCPLGTMYYGADSTAEEIDAAAEIGLPIVSVCGTHEVNGVFPLNCPPIDDKGPPPRVSADATPPHQIPENSLGGLAMWRRISGCASVSFEDDCDPRSTVEKKIGARFDGEETREIMGRLHYIGESNGADGYPMLRYVAVEGAPHCVAHTAAELAWEFLSRFYRDPETGKIELVCREKAYTTVEADTVYTVNGQMVTALRMKLKDGVDVSDLMPESFSIKAITNMVPVVRTMRVIGIERREKGVLTLITEEFLLNATAPKYGYINGSPGNVTNGAFKVVCDVTPGGMSLSFTRDDVEKINLEHAKRFTCARFEKEGMMGFDYVYFKSPRAAEGKPLPLIFYSMGSGNKNNDDNNRQILNYGAAMITSPAFQSIYPCHVVAPWFPMPKHPPQGEEGNAELFKYAQSTAECARTFAESVGADMDRIYFIGTGGGALYQHLAAQPDLYAAAAMITSVFNYFFDGSEIKYLKEVIDVPLYITHAQSDYPCPVERSRLAYSKLLEFGHKNVYYYEFSDEELRRSGIDTDNLAGSHDSGNINLGRPELYRWLFAQHK